jgi:hypothetical protein
MQDRTFSLIKLEQSPFAYYSKPIRVYCPYYKLGTTRTRTFHSLKKLDHHIAIEHKNDDMYPLFIQEIKEILKNLAKGLQWEILK